MRQRLLVMIFLLLVIKGNGQIAFRPQSPLAIPLKLAGTFGELRGNHYHSGIDLKTNGHSGEKVFAVANGFICRIKVSAAGFGNALYIHHPEGFTTVYAHLHSFTDSISRIVDSIQHGNKSYDVDYQPDSLLLPVLQGEQIGLSGNSGGSEGPHLHFEIRDRYSEEPLNPLQFNLPVSDTLQPEIVRFLAYYPEGKNWFQLPDMPDGDTIRTGKDTLGIAIYALDPDGNSMLGIYSAALFLGDSLIYTFRMDWFNFNETRLVNAHIDYEWWLRKNERLHRMHRLMNDQFSGFRNSGSGKIPVPLSGYYPLKIRIQDYMGNLAERNIVIEKTEQDSANKTLKGHRFYGDSLFSFRGSAFVATAEAGSFYQDESLHPVTINRKGKAEYLSDPTGFNNPGIVLHKPIRYRFPMPAKLKREEPDKMIIVETDSLGQLKSVYKATIINDSLELKIRKAALFSPAVDKEPPTILKYQIQKDTLSPHTYLKIRVKDNLSGIGNVTILQNGQWIPAYFESRTSEVIARIKMDLPAMIKIIISDPCNNEILLEIGL